MLRKILKCNIVHKLSRRGGRITTTIGGWEWIVILLAVADGMGRYEGVIGRFRYEGAKHAHLKAVLARVHRFESPRQVLEWQLAKNAYRRDLTEIDKDDALAPITYATLAM